MQHLVGYAAAVNGTLALSDVGAFLLNPWGVSSVCSLRQSCCSHTSHQRNRQSQAMRDCSKTDEIGFLNFPHNYPMRLRQGSWGKEKECPAMVLGDGVSVPKRWPVLGDC
jgi:hypothetical protein